MNSTNFYTPEKKKARIEIIPLIDVVFFLLATFVLFTLALDKIGSVPVTLPRVPPIPTPPDPTMVYVQASDGGAVYWKQGPDGVPVLISMAELPARLADLQQTMAVPKVFVRGDEKAKFGAAVLIFDEVRKAGIQEVSLETVPSKTGI